MEPAPPLSVERESKKLREGETDMRKAIAELDEEQRAALLQVADLGTAVCASALIVSVLRFIGGLI
jgi:DNA-directed RNA polymerase specialized sigma24 family protein